MNDMAKGALFVIVFQMAIVLGMIIYVQLTGLDIQLWSEGDE